MIDFSKVASNALVRLCDQMDDLPWRFEHKDLAVIDIPNPITVAHQVGQYEVRYNDHANRDMFTITVCFFTTTSATIDYIRSIIKERETNNG